MFNSFTLKIVFYVCFVHRIYSKPSNNDLTDEKFLNEKFVDEKLTDNKLRQIYCGDPDYFDFQSNGKFFPDDDDCNSYLQCLHGQLIRHHCPKLNDSEGYPLFVLHWDRLNQVCNWPGRICDCPSSKYYDEKCYDRLSTTTEVAASSESPTTETASTQMPTTETSTTKTPTIKSAIQTTTSTMKVGTIVSTTTLKPNPQYTNLKRTNMKEDTSKMVSKSSENESSDKK